MAICETTDFIYPMLADVFHPIVTQGVHGNVKKQWILDRTIAGSFAPVGGAGNEEVKPNVNITQESILLARVKTDIRFSSHEDRNAITNVLVSNIKDKFGNQIYVETAGTRAGKATIFEVATVEPFVGPFGKVEYFKIVLRRSENQGTDI